jgi:hypothetical protein
MTTLETMNVGANTRANNNIVWKNISVVDNFTGALMLTSVLVRNPFREPVEMGLRFVPTRETAERLSRAGRILIDLKPKLLERWMEGRSVGRGIKLIDRERGRIEIVGQEAFLQNIRVAPEETFGVDVMFEPAKGYRQPAYDDSKWKTGRAELGFGDDPETTIDGGPRGRRRITSYYRRAFDVADPSLLRDLMLHLKRDDGAIVYLNGREIHRVNLGAGAGPEAPASRSVDGAAEDTFFPSDVAIEHLRPGRNVLAVELHQDSPRTDDATFDLALTANNATRNVPPTVKFLSPAAGSLWQVGESVQVAIDGIDPDGKVRTVRFLVDGKQAGTANRQPFTFKWRARSIGPHRLRAVVLDAAGQRATAEVTISVVENVPPEVRLTAPAAGAGFRRGQPLVVSAQASDRGGRVARVEFWLREAEFFASKPQLVGTADRPPFAVTVREFPAGQHFMLTAVAVDDRGERSQSFPIHLSLEGGEGHPQH